MKFLENNKVMDRYIWGVVLLAFCFLCLSLLLARGAFAQEKDRSQWANSPHKKWYDSQEMNPAARERLGLSYKSCCDAGDHYRTRFRVAADNSDQWQYLTREGQWKVIPPDIHKEEETPEC